MKKQYSFQSLLHYDKDGGITGPMSPVLAINDFLKAMEVKHLIGACRVKNNQSHDLTYDHIILKSKCKFSNAYQMFVDMGCHTLPCAVWFDDDKDCVITPIYKKEITAERMYYHRVNMECPESKDNPIMILNEKEFIELFKQAELSEKLTINKPENVEM